jgi:hypothetical protein
MLRSKFDETVELILREDNPEIVADLTLEILDILGDLGDDCMEQFSVLMISDCLSARSLEEVLATMYDTEYVFDHPGMIESTQRCLYHSNLDVVLVAAFCLIHCTEDGIDTIWSALGSESKPIHYDVIFSLLWNLIY